jgi:Antitoxin-like ribbon-helix-helix
MMAKGKLHLPADLDLDAVVAKPGAGRPPAAFHEEPIASPPPTSVPVPIETTSPSMPQIMDLKTKAIATTLYLLPEDHRRLRRLAADREVAAQTLLLDAIDMLFVKNGQGPVQRWEPRRKVRP